MEKSVKTIKCIVKEKLGMKSGAVLDRYFGVGAVEVTVSGRGYRQALMTKEKSGIKVNNDGTMVGVRTFKKGCNVTAFNNREKSRSDQDVIDLGGASGKGAGNRVSVIVVFGIHRLVNRNKASGMAELGKG